MSVYICVCVCVCTKHFCNEANQGSDLFQICSDELLTSDKLAPLTLQFLPFLFMLRFDHTTTDFGQTHGELLFQIV